MKGQIVVTKVGPATKGDDTKYYAKIKLDGEVDISETRDEPFAPRQCKLFTINMESNSPVELFDRLISSLKAEVEAIKMPYPILDLD